MQGIDGKFPVDMVGDITPQATSQKANLENPVVLPNGKLLGFQSNTI